MNLLKDLIKNFRYKCVTNTSNEITVYFYYTAADSLNDSSITPIESGYTDKDEKEGKINTNLTLVRTENENEVRLNTMNAEIAKYIRNSKEISKITFKNLSKDHVFILESNVFKAATETCSNIEIDMGTTGAGFRVNGDTYDTIDNFKITESTIYLDTNCVLRFGKFKANWMKVKSYQYKDTPSTLHIFSSEDIHILGLYLYAPDKMVFGNNNGTDAESYANTKLSVNYLNIYGEEFIDSDKNDERILVTGFDKVYFDNINIEDNVGYSKIIRSNTVSKFSINTLTRNINIIIPVPMFIFESVGKVCLRNMNINVSSDATISENGFAIVSFPSVESDLDRSLYFYTAKITNNNTEAKLKVLKLRNISLDKVYLSDCTLGNNVDLLDIDDKSEISKLTFNNANFTTTSDLTIKGSTKVSLVDTKITSTATVYIDSPYINVTNGIWDIKTLYCNYSDSYLKIMFSSLELHANRMLVFNESEDDLRTIYLNDCKLDVLKEINIKNLNPSTINTYFKTEKLIFNTLGSIKLNGPLIGFQKNNKTEITFNSNFSGSISVDDVENTKLNLVCNVSNTENVKTNNLEIYLDNEKTNISWKTNRGFNCLINDLGKDYPVHISATSDLDDSKAINIRFSYDDDGNYVNKVINDSEKLINYTESINEDNAWKEFKFTKIS